MKQHVSGVFAIRPSAGGRLIGVATVVVDDEDGSVEVFQAPLLDPTDQGQSIDRVVREMNDAPHYYSSTAHGGLYRVEPMRMQP